jgi:hypothetical protein
MKSKSCTLSDGSIITLNIGDRVEIQFDIDSYLNGITGTVYSFPPRVKADTGKDAWFAMVRFDKPITLQVGEMHHTPVHPAYLKVLQAAT